MEEKGDEGVEKPPVYLVEVLGDAVLVYSYPCGKGHLVGLLPMLTPKLPRNKRQFNLVSTLPRWFVIFSHYSSHNMLNLEIASSNL